MKKHKLASAVAAGLYGFLAAHAAATQAPTLNADQKPTLQAVKIDQALLQKQQAARKKLNALQANDGLNVQMQPQKPQFKPEAGLTGEHVWIVRLRQAPVASYQGGLDGLPATQLASNKGQNKLFEQQKASPAVVSYQEFLKQTQRDVLQQINAEIGARELRQQYVNSFNGFSLIMTQDEAARVAELADVLSVTRSQLHPLHTDVGPTRIRADKVWAGNTTVNLPVKGEGTIVGILDTGVNSDHRAFADKGDDGYDHTNPLGMGNYLGDCKTAEFASRCNDKLIGIYSYDVITDTYQGLYPAVGEDVSGHGSHTASTAAGNVLRDVDYVVPELAAAGDGHVVKAGLFPQLSGVAPHANLVTYQVCLPLQGCPTEAILAAIEDATADGVDAINFSIGNVTNLTSPWHDPIELAFLGAHQAGVAVAASAGNAGSIGGAEAGSYIDHVSPWLLNVAAATTGRTIDVDVKLQDFVGGSNAPNAPIEGGGVNQAPLTGVVVSAADFGDASCLQPFAAGTFDNLKNAAGEAYVDQQGQPANIIVACQRGENGRVAKSSNVAAGGAEGFILYNASSWGDDAGIVKTDSYAVPGIHIAQNDWVRLSSWLATESATGHRLTISDTTVARLIDDSKADELADFSSRGPSLANPEHLVPSVTAPGVDIYAAINDESPFAAALGETAATADFGFMSGTSMAAPHVTGALALLSQAHPDWTVAEKQAALQLTADPSVVRVKYLGQPWETRAKAEIYRAGTGRINVANAINAGLIMDESYDNMVAADPDNGGLVHKLNLPEMVNFSCKPTCTWVRTFTATEDGSWTLNADEITNWSPYDEYRFVQPSAKLEIVPNKFSLKKGQSQTVMVRASVQDAQDISGNSEVELHSHLLLTEDSGKAPAMRLPVVFKFDGGDLPAKVDITAHRNSSSYQLNKVPMPAMNNGVVRVFEASKAHTGQVTLRKDDDFIFPFSQEAQATYETRMDEATFGFWMDVPANSSRLMVETLRRVSSTAENAWDFGAAVLYVGKDYNSDGVMDPQTELVCMSSHATLNNYCNLNNPEPGKYWAVFYNPNDYKTPSSDTFEYGWGIVSKTPARDLSMDAPVTDGKKPVDLTLRWQKPEMVEGDRFYTAFDVGTTANNPGNVGIVPVTLTRGVDDVSMTASKTAARVGQRVNYQIHTLPNLTGADRGFVLTANIPSGLAVTAQDVTFSDDASISSVTVEQGTLVVKGKQLNTLGATPTYKVTTNQQDASCKVPDFGQNNSAYLNLYDFGMGPGIDAGNNDDLRHGFEVPYDLMFGDGGGFSLYNNQSALSKSLFVRGNGNVSLDGAPYFFPMHMPFPYNSFPYQAIGVLWRGWGGQPLSMDAMVTPLGYEQGPTGITIASSTNGWAIVEWDGARSNRYEGMDDNWNPIYTDLDDRFEFELLLQNKTRFGKNEYEMIMAYNQLDYAGSYRGAVGVQGYTGLSDWFGPLEGLLGTEVAFDNLNEKLAVGQVLCYDYQGPESSQFTVKINAEVLPSAIVSQQTVAVTSQVDGMADISMSKSVQINGNLTVGAISAQQVNEDGTLTGIPVIYADEDNNRNQITVSGAHIKGVAHGGDSGSTIDITPDANFAGSTTVTVTVADLDNPADHTSTSFALTVKPLNDAPVAKVASSSVSSTAGANVTLDASSSVDVDGDALTYQWTQTSGPSVAVNGAGSKLTLTALAAGDYGFKVVVSDGQTQSEAAVTVKVTAEQQVVVTQDKSGGSAGLLALLLAPLALWRRRQRRTH